jgi:TatD DNase family protein
MELTDTHCHIHEALGTAKLSTETKARYNKAGSPTPDDMIVSAIADDVTRIIVVGTTLEDSEIAVDFAKKRDAVWSSIGLHPHEAKIYAHDNRALKQFAELAGSPKLVAVGECGLDYYYNHSMPEDQAAILRFQIELALEHDLAMVFHVREAFDDFWPIFDEYKGVRGVVHSFTGNRKDLDDVLDRGLYVGLNGITTFTNKHDQLEAIKAVPLPKLLLETDAPFLTPAPHRGRLCEPKHIRVTAEFLAELRGESLPELARQTTENAQSVFRLR